MNPTEQLRQAALQKMSDELGLPVRDIEFCNRLANTIDARDYDDPAWMNRVMGHVSRHVGAIVTAALVFGGFCGAVIALFLAWVFG